MFSIVRVCFFFQLFNTSLAIFRYYSKLTIRYVCPKSSNNLSIFYRLLLLNIIELGIQYARLVGFFKTVSLVVTQEDSISTE